MPDNDVLAIIRREHVLLRLGQTGHIGRRAPHRRNRKQHRALFEKQHGDAAEIADRNDNQQPLQDGHFRTDLAAARGYIALTMFSVIFLASPSSIMVLSR